MELKIELMKLGKKQVDVAEELNKRGIVVTMPELSSALAGRPRPKFDAIREATAELIEEWKKG